MSRRRRAATNTVSLFPFLAVLVCAMGALIFLLVVNTRRIRLQSIARTQESQQESAAPAPTLPSPDNRTDENDIVERMLPTTAETEVASAERIPTESAEEPTVDIHSIWQENIAALIDQRNVRRARTAKHEQERSQVIQRLQDTSAQIGLAANEQRRLAQNREQADRTLERISQEQDAIADEILETTQQLAQVQHQRAQAVGKFALVAYDGQNGTTRRPIIIECTEDGVRFVPENVLLTADDLDGFTKGYNPLLAGSRALVRYWTQWNQRQPDPGAEPKPYVLLIVRPSGSLAYYAARNYLQRLETPFGYELIEKDRSLLFPDPDPNAQQACRTAVRQVLTERKQLVEEITRGYPNRRRTGRRLERGDVSTTQEFPSFDSRRFVGDARGRRDADERTRSESPWSRSQPASTASTEDSRGIRTRGGFDKSTVSKHRGHSAPQEQIGTQPDRIPSLSFTGRGNAFGSGIGFERQLTIYVDVDRISVGNQSPFFLGHGESGAQLADRFVTTLDQQFAEWEKPPQGFRWVPALRFVVSPGGNQHYERLLPFLKHWTVESSIIFTLEHSSTLRRPE